MVCHTRSYGVGLPLFFGTLGNIYHKDVTWHTPNTGLRVLIPM